MSTTINITDIYAYWNLSFEDPNTNQTTIFAVPILDENSDPLLVCETKKFGVKWRLIYPSVSTTNILTEVELLPVSSRFIASNASVDIKPVVPETNPVLSLGFKIPAPGDSDSTVTAGVETDPGWALTVKVRKRLSV